MHAHASTPALRRGLNLNRCFGGKAYTARSEKNCACIWCVTIWTNVAGRTTWPISWGGAIKTVPRIMLRVHACMHVAHTEDFLSCEIFFFLSQNFPRRVSTRVGSRGKVQQLFGIWFHLVLGNWKKKKTSTTTKNFQEYTERVINNG